MLFRGVRMVYCRSLNSRSRQRSSSLRLFCFSQLAPLLASASSTLGRTRIGVTESGRTYELVSGPGTSSNAEYVWATWRGLNRLTTETDVTEQYLPTEAQRAALPSYRGPATSQKP